MTSRVRMFVLATVASIAIGTGAIKGTNAQQPRSDLFALLFTTGPGWDTTKAPNLQRHFATHSANLQRLRQAGSIVTGGRFGPYGLILVRAPNADSARALLAPDSSLSTGTFKVQIDRWSTIYDGNVSR